MRVRSGKLMMLMLLSVAGCSPSTQDSAPTISGAAVPPTIRSTRGADAVARPPQWPEQEDPNPPSASVPTEPSYPAPFKAYACENAASPWPMSGHDPLQTHRSSAVGPSNPKVAWSIGVGDQLSDPIVGANGNAIISSSSGAVSTAQIRSISKAGQVLWSRQLPDGFMSAPALTADGSLVVAREPGVLEWLDPDTGLLKSSVSVYSKPTKPEFSNVTADCDRTVVVAAYAPPDVGGRVVAASESGVYWHYDVLGDDTFPAAIGPSGTVYASGLALDSTGALWWQGGILVTSISSDGTLYGELRAATASGHLLWTKPLPASWDATGTGLTSLGELIAVDAPYVLSLHPDGTPNWTVQVPLQLGELRSSPPVIDANDVTYAAMFSHPYSSTDSPQTAVVAVSATGCGFRKFCRRRSGNSGRLILQLS